MSVGAVLFRTGTAKGSELGGLYKTMPVTMVFCVIGAASISAFPLFSGFVSKSMILSAAAQEGHFVTWAILLFASAAVLHHSGIKIPYFAFYGRDSGKRPAEAPWNMLLAMGLTAFLCIAIGVWPNALYSVLPFDVSYNPYSTTHVITQIQLLFFSAIAFAALIRMGLFPRQVRSVILDTDWIYRKLLPAIISFVVLFVSAVWSEIVRGFNNTITAVQNTLANFYGPEGRVARVQPTGYMVLWLAILLGAALIVNLVGLP